MDFLILVVLIFFWTKWIFQPLQSKFCQDLNYDLGARAYAQSQISPLL